jgi:hypothetical protein
MWKEVTYEEFYEQIGNVDAVITVEGKYPFTVKFSLRQGGLVGQVVGGETGEASKYYPVSNPQE